MSCNCKLHQYMRQSTHRSRRSPGHSTPALSDRPDGGAAGTPPMTTMASTVRPRRRRVPGHGSARAAAGVRQRLDAGSGAMCLGGSPSTGRRPGCSQQQLVTKPSGTRRARTVMLVISLFPRPACGGSARHRATGRRWRSYDSRRGAERPGRSWSRHVDTSGASNSTTREKDACLSSSCSGHKATAARRTRPAASSRAGTVD